MLPLAEEVASATSFMVADTFMVELILGDTESWKPLTDDPLAAASTMTHAVDRRIIKVTRFFRGEEDALSEFLVEM